MNIFFVFFIISFAALCLLAADLVLWHKTEDFLDKVGGLLGAASFVGWFLVGTIIQICLPKSVYRKYCDKTGQLMCSIKSI